MSPLDTIVRSPAVHTRLKTASILIIEDQDGSRDVLVALLRRDYRLYTAQTASDALRILRRHRIDLIITDIGLPDRNGLDLLHDLQPLRDTKVIVISGAGSVETAQKALSLGAVAYLLKPYNIEELLTLVHKTVPLALTN